MSRSRFIGLLLALLTLLVYLPAARHGFSIFDDDDYVTGNRIVQNGLTRTGVIWAFTTRHSSNWHPVTWLSHMTDCELFGLNPGAHHVVNVLLHALNAALLFALLFRLTSALGPAAFVAGLFAWHPLHVESVAWIAERKDVLSTAFALLSLLAYTRFAQKQPNLAAPTPDPQPATRYYVLALACFTLGLMAKPMLVTLPFVMLLLDYWPLQRFNRFVLPRRVLEKWPFFLLAAVSCVVTCLAQHKGGMVVSLEEMPPTYRLENVVLAYLRYLFKIIWPVHLAIFYPLPRTISPLSVIGAGVILIAISIAVWRGRQRAPYGLVGWLWFLGTLVPVIGLVQVGQAAMSDRYTYFPSIGLFVAVAFALRDETCPFRFPSRALTTAAVLILAAGVLLTENQLRYWRDDEALFSHAVKVTRDNEPARLCLGQVYEMQGRPAEAMAEYRIALDLNPWRVKTYNSFAMLLARTGSTNEALAEIRKALRRFPADAPSHDSLANLLADSGCTNEALEEWREAVRLDPKTAAFHDNLGTWLVELGRYDEAMNQYAEAARGDPTDWRAPYLTGKALLKQGRDAEAIPYFHRALQTDPDNLRVLIFLARVLAADENPEVRDGRAALNLAARANGLTGDVQPAMLDVLAMACAESGSFDDAQKTAQRALELTRASGRTNDVDMVQRRLQLYRNHQPWRESFRATHRLPETSPELH